MPEPPSPPLPPEDPLRVFIEKIRYVFNALWPIVLAIIGILMVPAFLLYPPLREPALIASISGFFTVVSTIGLALRGSS